MTKTPAVRLLLAGFVLLVSSVTHASAQTPGPAQMLDPKLGPKFDDVNITVPTADELKACTVELVQGTAAKSAGWLLKDGKKQSLRRYFDSDGDGKVDLWTYYKDGVEVYREFDSAQKGTPNNFRWLNGAGMKWGVGGVDPKSGKGYVASWRMISAEEVSHEAFQAVATRDFNRLQALFISDAEMQALKLPANKAKELAAIQEQAEKKFAKFIDTVKLAGGKFDSVEGSTPSCDTTTGDVEVIKYPSRAIRYLANEKHAWIHTGEMIQVGLAWRIVDVPNTGDPIIEPKRPDASPELEKFLKALADLDENQPKGSQILDKNAKVDAYYRKRIELIQQILRADKADQREGWYKQLFDNLTAMAQNNGDAATMNMLKKMKDDVVTSMPGSNLAAYGTYRHMWTEYAIGTASVKPPGVDKEIARLTDKWLDDLTDFVKKYSKADDTPEALHQLAIGCEFTGKTAEAKRWYKELFDGFPNHHLAPRSRGSLARLNLVGAEMTLNAPLLNDPTTKFDIASLKGKVVIVHYWSSFSEQYQADFPRLQLEMNKVAAKSNVELVCINLDDDAAKAKEAVAKTKAPGIHLFQASNNASGLNSPLATQYGIHMLPTIFMIGRDGRGIANSLQIGDIEAELKAKTVPQ